MLSSQTNPKSNKTPALHYIWIGQPPAKTKAVPGQDVMCPKKMTKQNKSNPIYFWCLDKYVDHYIQEFKDHDIQVCSIEKYLNEKFADSFVQNAAEFVKEMMLESLKENRNTVRDKVNVKNVMSLFLLLSKGDYVLDSNIMPMDEKTIQLNHYEEFRMPTFVFNQVRHVDFWMMYAPRDNKSRIKKTFQVYQDKWENLQRIYDSLGYVEQFHQLSASAMIDATLEIKGEKIAFWDARLKDSCTLAMVDELGLVKNYCNTHKYIMRNEYNDDHQLVRNQFNQFLSGTQLSLFSTSLRNIIFDYISDDAMEIFKEQVMSGKKYNELFAAVYCNHIDKLKNLVAQGVNLDQQMTLDEMYGETPAHVAIRRNRPECLKILIENRARLDLEVKYGKFKPISAMDMLKKVSGTSASFTAILQEYEASKNQNKMTGGG